MVARRLSIPLSIRFAPARTEDVRHVCGDPALGKELLGFEASTSLEEGLSKTADWFRSTSGQGGTGGISSVSDAAQETRGRAVIAKVPRQQGFAIREIAVLDKKTRGQLASP
jgi:hypothetical protein